jgi:hypothetical protein
MRQPEGVRAISASWSEAKANVNADALVQAKGQAVTMVAAAQQCRAQAQSMAHARAPAPAEGKAQVQTLAKGLLQTKNGMSLKDKAAVQHLQLQAQYQHDHSLQMQKRVEDEVHAVVSTAQQAQTDRGGANRQTKRANIGQYMQVDEKAGAEMVTQQPASNKAGGRSAWSAAADFGLEGGGQGLPVEKLTTRRDRNREHARKSRLRKKLLVVAEQQRVTELEQTNRILVEALQKYAPPAHLNSILAGAVQGGMAAAMTPMAEPTLPRSQWNTGSGAGDSNAENADTTRMDMQGSGSSSAHSPPRPGDSNSGAASKPVKVQMRAAHLHVELGILEALRRSLVQREQAVVQREQMVTQMERDNADREVMRTTSEQKLAVGKAYLMEQQSKLVHAQQTKSDGAGAGGAAGNEYDIGRNDHRGLPLGVNAHHEPKSDGEMAVDEMMQLLGSMEDTPFGQISPQACPPSPPGDAAMDLTSSSGSLHL